MLKYLLSILILLLLNLSSIAQEVRLDSTVQTTEIIADSTIVQVKKNKPKKKEGFGETLVSLGKGFLDRLKYRFNLEAIEEKVGNAKEKIKKKDSKKKGN